MVNAFCSFVRTVVSGLLFLTFLVSVSPQLAEAQTCPTNNNPNLIVADCTQSSGNINGPTVISSGVTVTLLGTSSIVGDTNGMLSGNGAVSIGNGSTWTNSSSLGDFGISARLGGFTVTSNAQYSLQSNNALYASNTSVSGTANIYGALLGGVVINSGGLMNIYSSGSVTPVGGSFVLGGSLNNAGTVDGEITIGSGQSASLINSGSVTGLGGANSAGIYIATGGTSSISNSGSISGGGPNSGAITNAGQLSSLTNTNLINGSNGIYNTGSVGSINNFGSNALIAGGNQSIFNLGAIQYLENSGQLRNAYNGIYNQYGAQFSSISNSGSISGDATGITNIGNLGSILNTGTISANTHAINNGADVILGQRVRGTIVSFINAVTGVVNGGINGVSNYGGAITGLTNNGLITGGTNGIQNSGVINALTNTGNIVGGAGYGIENRQITTPDTHVTYVGLIQTFNNGQGSNSSGGILSYKGILPTNYNVIVRSPSQYGQLAVTNGIGATTFGIYGGGVAGVAASTLSKGTYASVLSGVAASNLTGATKGNYSGFNWSLSQVDATNGIWNLFVTGASTADTQQSLVNTSAVLQDTFTLQNAVLANGLSYDCNVFGANDVCVSAGGRNTAVSAANGLNNTSALLIAAYRLNPNYRIGAYADQNLSVHNSGSAVNLGNNTPLLGLFAAWNERQDGIGTEVKVSAAYGQKNTTVTRQVVGSSEAGSGSSQLNSQGAQVTAKYGFGVMENVIVSPYVGMRYTQNNMNGYSEQATSSVTAPLTYSALNTNATTALAGVGASYKVIPAVTTFASAGVETDTNTSNGTYSATGVVGLAPINFNANPVRTRPTATLGAYYDIEKNQRLGLTGIYRQEAYQAVQTTTVMATYTVGL